MDKNDYYGGESSSLNLIQVTYLVFTTGVELKYAQTTLKSSSLFSLDPVREDWKMSLKWKCGIS